MTEDRSLERAARSWIEAGPTEAPERAVDAALLLIQTTPQERDWHVPWRSRPMTQTTRLLAGSVAVAIALLGGVFVLRFTENHGIGGPSPSNLTPTASPAPTSSPPVDASLPILDRTFTSDRYGYTVAYPSGWTRELATASWAAGAKNNWGSGMNDELSTTSVRFSAAAQQLADGQTADAWLQAYGALFGSGAPATWPTVTIAGQKGRIDFDGVASGATGISPGGVAFDAVVVSGRFAYNFNMDGNVDRPTFEAFLATVTLPSVPALDQTFTSPLGGYSIDHPATWTVTPAPRAWTSGYETQTVSDQIGAAPKIYGTSMKLPAGTSFETWFAAYAADRTLGTSCGAPTQDEDITVDGIVGHLDVHCPSYYLEAVVSKGGRVYVLTMFTPFSRPLFESLLATVRLTPASAEN
jgi:hypothetical protein